MSVKTLEVGIAPDAIEQIAKVAVERAVEELIWNALDAEATKVEVAFVTNALDGIDQVVISDNGHGISYEQAEHIFRQIGGSPKTNRRRSPKLDRPYHGKEGKGRYKAFSIGRTVVWQSRAMQKGVLQSFGIKLTSIQIKKAEIDSPTASEGEPGCDVTIRDIRENAARLRGAACVECLAHRLAPYLIAHPDIKVVYDGNLLDIRDLLLRDESFDILPEAAEGLTPSQRSSGFSNGRKPGSRACTTATATAWRSTKCRLACGRAGTPSPLTCSPTGCDNCTN